MITRNLTLRRSDAGYWLQLSRLDMPELAKIAKKYNDQVSVKISRPLASKTMAQLAAFHPLSTAFYLTGMYSAPDQFRQSYWLFRYWLKIEFGPVTWADYQGAHIPICKSIADYTIQEMTRLIEGTIHIINESGAYAASKEIRGIIEGMNHE